MAAGLTDHIWSIRELLMYKIAPAACREPKQTKRHQRSTVDPTGLKRPRGRPRTRPLPDPSVPKRPRGRPRKYPLLGKTMPKQPEEVAWACSPVSGGLPAGKRQN